jgi:DNA-binding IclR family transcriptional regulator
MTGKTSEAEAKSARRGIQSVEIAYRLLTALQSSPESLALKEVAMRAGLSASAANNYLVSLVRTGLATTDIKAGFYRLGPAALALGMSAIQQIDGFELVRLEVTSLRNATQRSAAVTAWTDDGPVSLFKQDGEHRGAFEMRTGLIPLLTTAAGKVFVACLSEPATTQLIDQELKGALSTTGSATDFRADALRELQRKKYSTVHRADMSGYASMAAPVWDWNGEIRFAISLVGSRSTLLTERGSAHVRALLESAARATAGLGGVSPL